MAKEISHSSSSPIIIDLDHFKLYLDTQGTRKLTLHFDTPSRRFYLSVIALVVEQMREKGIDATVPLRDHTEILALLNETVAGGAGSSKEKKLLSRVYKKWKSILPDLENAPLFQVMGKSKDYGDGSGKTYQFDESVKDAWANLFEYKGSQEKLRLRFSVEKLGVRLEDVVIAYGNQSDTHERKAWDRFVEALRENEDKRLESAGHNGSVNSPEFVEETEEGGGFKTTVDAHDQMENRLPTGKQASVEPAISDPYMPLRSGEVITVSAKGFSDQRTQFKRRKRFGLMLISSLFLLMAAVALWKFYLHPTFQLDSMKSETPVSPEVSSEVSIAVLPFANISGDPKDDYLCDGITEQIITSLSRTPKLFVIASNSTFTYKGKPVKIQQVRKDLGVRYVLEGSVQKLGDRVRITAQLIDAVCPFGKRA
jgi:TolB-like protein